MSRPSRRPAPGTRALAVLSAALLATAVRAPAAGAQSNEASAGATVSFQGYSFDEAATAGVQNLRLISLHFAATTPVVDRLTLAVNGSWGKGTLGRASGPLDVTGLTDTQLTLTYVHNLYFRVSGVLIAPTGKETQTLRESIVAGALASDLFPFDIANWGSGGGAGVNASVARPLGAVGAGLAVGLIAGREFEPLEGGQFAYRPGTLLRIVGALDGTVGEASKASLQVAFHRYGRDQVDGDNLFQSGNRFQVMGSLAFPTSAASSGIVYGGVTHRQGGSLLAELPIAEASAAQNLFLLGGGFRRPIGGAVLQPDAELRVLRRDDSMGQGIDLGVGATLEMRGRRGTFAPSARVHFGQLEVVSGNSGSILGLELGMTARIRGGS
jgi:hypothetical protein